MLINDETKSGMSKKLQMPPSIDATLLSSMRERAEGEVGAPEGHNGTQQRVGADLGFGVPAVTNLFAAWVTPPKGANSGWGDSSSSLMHEGAKVVL